MPAESDIKDLERRIAALEKKEKPSEPKKKREPSEYNKFMAQYIKEQKEKGSKKSHTELFTEASGAWTSSKKTSS
jgi:hypothetical protein